MNTDVAVDGNGDGEAIKAMLGKIRKSRKQPHSLV